MQYIYYKITIGYTYTVYGRPVSLRRLSNQFSRRVLAKTGETQNADSPVTETEK